MVFPNKNQNVYFRGWFMVANFTHYNKLLKMLSLRWARNVTDNNHGQKPARFFLTARTWQSSSNKRFGVTSRTRFSLTSGGSKSLRLATLLLWRRASSNHCGVYCFFLDSSTGWFYVPITFCALINRVTDGFFTWKQRKYENTHASTRVFVLVIILLRAFLCE